MKEMGQERRIVAVAYSPTPLSTKTVLLEQDRAAEAKFKVVGKQPFGMEDFVQQVGLAVPALSYCSDHSTLIHNERRLFRTQRAGL